MGPLPKISIDPAAWPDPRADGVTELTPAQAAMHLAVLTALIDYIEEQHAACAKPAPTSAD